MAPEDEKSDHPEGQQPVQQMPRVRTSDLMKGQKEIIIEHAGAEYRLRITSQNKLILTK